MPVRGNWTKMHTIRFDDLLHPVALAVLPLFLPSAPRGDLFVLLPDVDLVQGTLLRLTYSHDDHDDLPKQRRAALRHTQGFTAPNPRGDSHTPRLSLSVLPSIS
ncbi:hypothetical protein H4582DRAFT_2073691 [Lactarius indigo]|nr:hypothetical protein H4582DRAFT_2073691 [Lactarius indigo]